MGRGSMKAFHTLAAGLVFALASLSCTDGTGPEPVLRLLFDSGTVTPGSNLQLTALDGEGEVVWSSDDPSVASVVARTGWVTGVATGSTLIRANDGTSEVTATIQVRTPPLLQTGAPTATFEAVAGQGDPADQSIAITNGGDLPLTGLTVGTIQYGAGETPGWLTATLAATAAPTQLQLAASTSGLSPGTYTATLSVASSVSINGPQSLAVTLVVLRPPSIELGTQLAEIGTTPGTDSPPTVVAITNGGDQPLTGLQISVAYPGGGPSGWLSATLDASTAPTSLRLVGRGGLVPQGQYSATVTVSSSVSGVAPRALDVDFVVAPGPAITLSATDVAFTGVVSQGSPAPKSVQVNNGGGGTLSQLSVGPISYNGAGGWLSAALTTGTAPASIVFTPNTAGLGAGTYSASVTVQSPVATNSPRTITVTLEVATAPVISIFPPSLIFTSIRTKGDPSAQALQITNGGGGTLEGLSVDILYQGGATGWLALTLGSTTGPTTLVARPSAAGLAVGTYQASVTINSTTPGVASRTFTVQYEIRWSYEVDIQPFFTTSYPGFGFTACTGCHTSGGDSPNLSSANTAYQALIGGGLVVPGNPNAGRLICKIEGNSGCGTAMPLPAAQIARIREWIAQGAPY